MDGSAQDNANQFGRQTRADAAKRALVLAVQQGISTLPPTSGQSLIYEFNPEMDVPVRSEQLGPVSLRAAQTIGAGNWSVRLAASYFSLSEKLGPIDYLFNFDDRTRPSRFASIGTEISADVGLLNLSLNYGVTHASEVTANVPIVLIDAHADQTFSSEPHTGNTLGFRFSRAELHQDLASRALLRRRASFGELGSRFDDGGQVGVGRISLGGKYAIVRRERAQLSFSTELFLPSPSEDDYAGSESVAILPRLIAAARVSKIVRLHADLGYDYDFEVSELRRLVWNVGPSFAFSGVTVDCGVGGSNFQSGIDWTPKVARGLSPAATVPDITATALGNTELGSDFIDALAGVKVQVAAGTVISGAVNVPLNRDGIRPAAVGTIAVETYF